MAWINPTRLRRTILAIVKSTPWRFILGDLVLVSIWIVVVSFIFRTVHWPTWLYYGVVFAGVIGYSLTNDWETIWQTL